MIPTSKPRSSRREAEPLRAGGTEHAQHPELGSNKLGRLVKFEMGSIGRLGHLELGFLSDVCRLEVWLVLKTEVHFPKGCRRAFFRRTSCWKGIGLKGNSNWKPPMAAPYFWLGYLKKGERGWFNDMLVPWVSFFQSGCLG